VGQHGDGNDTQKPLHVVSSVGFEVLQREKGKTCKMTEKALHRLCTGLHSSSFSNLLVE
jgi:hypothetical protein